MVYPKDKYVVKLCAFCIEDYSNGEIVFTVPKQDLLIVESKDFKTCDHYEIGSYNRKVTRRNKEYLKTHKIERLVDYVDAIN